MTHLETLIRILPRRRRALATQRRRGAWQLFIGLFIASMQSYRLAYDAPAPGFDLYSALAGAIIGGACLLAGLYRLTRADILIALVDAEIIAVDVALHDRVGGARPNTIGNALARDELTAAVTTARKALAWKDA